MGGTARCNTCFRSERRTDSGVEVLMTGGGRRPDLPADLAIWRTYRQVHAGEIDAPVAVCSGCGQPMFCVEGDLPRLQRWELALPDGAIVVGPEGVEGDAADADRRIEAYYREAVEAKPTKGQIGFAVVGMIMGAGIAAIIGLVDCPTVAFGVAAAAAAPAATRRLRGPRR